MSDAAPRQTWNLERDHWWFRGRRRVYTSLLEAHLGHARPLRILDVGCGAGGFLESLATLADEVHAIDVEPADLGRASLRGLGTCARGAAEALPYRDATFDVVCLFDVIEHVDDDRAVLREAFRVVRPGGLVVASAPAYPWLHSDDDRVAGHCRRYTRGSLRLLAARARLRIERLTHTNVALFPLIAPAVLALRAVESLRVFGSRSARTNFGLPLPRLAHRAFERIFAAELGLSSRFDLPFGHSILMIARRPQTSFGVRARRVRSKLAGRLRRAA
jgi:SAM-dependent methyltransferase